MKPKLNVEVVRKFILACSDESPGGEYTNHWRREGNGDGQEEYAIVRRDWPKADIEIHTYEVITTSGETIKPDEPCTGSGYAHKPHGNCPGYTTDRT